MSKRIPSVVIKDMLNCIEHIQSYTKNSSFDDFVLNYMAVEACLYNINIIGEAVAQLADDIKHATPQVPWPLIIGMRTRLIQEYFGTDLPTVWNVIQNELPSFKIELKKSEQTLLKKDDN